MKLIVNGKPYTTNASTLLDLKAELQIPLNPEQTILDAIKLVTKENHSTIPVVDAKFCLVGLITKSSLVTTLSQQYFDYTEEAQE